MIKVLKILFWLGLAFFVLTVVLGLAALFSPGLHKWALVRALEEDGAQVQVASARFGLGRLSLRDFYWLKDGQGLAIRRADLRLSLADLIFKGELNIRKFELSGFELDLSRASQSLPATIPSAARMGGTSDPATPSDQPPRRVQGSLKVEVDAPRFQRTGPFNGFLPPASLVQAVVRIGQLSVDGMIHLSATRRLSFEAEAHALEPGSLGQFTWNAYLRDSSATAAAEELRLSGWMIPAQRPQGGLSSITLESTATASGGLFDQAVAVKLFSVIESVEDGERYVLRLLDPESGSEVVLAEFTGQWSRPRDRMDFEVRGDLAGERIAPLLLGHCVPRARFVLDGGGEWHPQEGSLGLEGTLSTSSLPGDPEGGLLWSFSGKRDAGGRMNLASPFEWTLDGRRSAGVLTLDGAWVEDRLLGRANLAGQSLNLDDLQVLLGNTLGITTPPAPPVPPVADGASGPAPTTPSGPVAATPAPASGRTTGQPLGGPPALPDQDPAWRWYEGPVDLQVARCQTSGLVLENLRGTLIVHRDHLHLQELVANLDGQPTTLSGRLDFRKGLDLPYDLRAHFRADSLDAARLLRNPENADTPPWVEGAFNLRARVAASAPSLELLGPAAALEFSLDSPGGRIRPLGGVGDRVGQAIDIVGSLSALVGGRRIPGADAVSNLTQRLREVPFQRLQVEGARRADGAWDLSSCLVESADLQIRGAGGLTPLEGREILDFPIRASFTLRVPPQSGLVSDLSALGLLGSADADGLRVGPTFQFTGSLRSPKSNLLEVLTQAGGRKLGLVSD